MSLHKALKKFAQKHREYNSGYKSRHIFDAEGRWTCTIMRRQMNLYKAAEALTVEAKKYMQTPMEKRTTPGTQKGRKKTATVERFLSLMDGEWQEDCFYHIDALIRATRKTMR